MRASYSIEDLRAGTTGSTLYPEQDRWSPTSRLRDATAAQVDAHNQGPGDRLLTS